MTQSLRLAPLLLAQWCLCWPGCAALAASDLPAAAYALDAVAEDLNRVQQVLPERSNNSASISAGTDPNIRLLQAAGVSVTFLYEGVGSKNSFGYFLFDRDGGILGMDTIFANASVAGGGGDLIAGDSVDLGVYSAGTNIGFWLQRNGASNGNGFVFYTLDGYNPDGERHVAVITEPGSERAIVGIEDIKNLGDQDFNDFVFSYTVTPLLAAADALPSGAPESGPMATALILAALFTVYAVRRRAMSRVTTSTHRHNTKRALGPA